MVLRAVINLCHPNKQNGTGTHTNLLLPINHNNCSKNNRHHKRGKALPFQKIAESFQLSRMKRFCQKAE